MGPFLRTFEVQFEKEEINLLWLLVKDKKDQNHTTHLLLESFYSGVASWTKKHHTQGL